MKTTSVGISFREAMSGPFSLDATEPHAGVDKGKAAGTVLTMNAAILIRDLDEFVEHPEHAGELVGSVTFGPLGENLPAKNGKFNLFSPAGEPETRPAASMPWWPAARAASFDGEAQEGGGKNWGRMGFCGSNASLPVGALA